MPAVRDREHVVLVEVDEACSLPSGASWLITVETRRYLSRAMHYRQMELLTLHRCDQRGDAHQVRNVSSGVKL